MSRFLLDMRTRALSLCPSLALGSTSSPIASSESAASEEKRAIARSALAVDNFMPADIDTKLGLGFDSIIAELKVGKACVVQTTNDEAAEETKPLLGLIKATIQPGLRDSTPVLVARDHNLMWMVNDEPKSYRDNAVNKDNLLRFRLFETMDLPPYKPAW